MKLFLWVRSVLLTVTAVIGVICVVAVGASVLFQVKPLVVISGSMEPSIPVGSAILSRTVPAEDLAVGDVVTVTKRRGNDLVTHRIVEIAENPDGSRELTLKGDANDVIDPYTYPVTSAARHVATVPGAGYAIAWVQSRTGMLTVLAGVLGVTLLFFAGPDDETKPRRRVGLAPDPGAESGDEHPGASAVPATVLTAGPTAPSVTRRLLRNAPGSDGNTPTEPASTDIRLAPRRVRDRRHPIS
ncbi:signal peptidase I [Cellulomonas hominis]